jgi:maltokinase
MDDTLSLLTTWMPRQRWFSGKDRDPRLERVAGWRLEREGAVVEVLLIADTAGDERVVYQVPIVRRSATPDGGEVPGLIGARGSEILIDGAVDPAFHALLYSWVREGGRTEDADGALTGVAVGLDDVAPTAHASVLAGEQSNTSLIYRPEGEARPVICKIFRQVGIGTNPDIELQSALAAAGALFVPPVVGTVTGEWTQDATPVQGALAFAQEFFAGVEDAWRVALRAAAEGAPFAAEAGALGRAVAEMHVLLAQEFPTRPATADDLAAVGAVWRQRLDTAIAVVPELEASRPAIEAVYERALAGNAAELQRIHGDLHLGQVLDVAGRGWVLLDFEGEPLRTLAERREPDLAVRDVAGMLRSFAYAADSVRDPAVHEARRRWAAEAREGFLLGYDEVAASPLDAELLRALEIDKSVYQTVYDARNRPDWTPIPLAAIADLIA